MKRNKFSIIIVIICVAILAMQLRNCSRSQENSRQLIKENKELKHEIDSLKSNRDTVIEYIKEIETKYYPKIIEAKNTTRPDTIIKQILNTDSVTMNMIAVELVKCQRDSEKIKEYEKLKALDDKLLKRWDSAYLKLLVNYKLMEMKMKKNRIKDKATGAGIVIICERIISWFF